MSARTPLHRRRGAGRTAVAMLACSLILAACSDADGDGSAAPATSTTSTTVSTTTSTAPTTTTTEREGRAFVTATTVAPLVAPSTTVPDEGTVALSELAAGDCADLPGLGLDESVEVTTAEVLPCEDPHGVEIYLVTSLNDDPAASYPGDTAVIAAADQVCLDGFEAYVGAAYLDSSLEIVHIRPDAGIWEDGDRRVHCGVHDRDLEPLTGTVQGSGR
ncbi:septum formation family protein [Actinomarinicola tropica]|uniref:Septum formation-related domain-containing protein n=1 Tax=Actinomarinicola tropica TaxID=2789776 RepID=A0A5Q2RJF9_9ACTN|nr:septum formation family protein [Actinomarinicola tropica]QGG94526.1 hypothetical protein GH723_05075 [Actinomarinicola tropica]